MILHILTPSTVHAPAALASDGIAAQGDWIADLRRFPPTVHQVQRNQSCVDITPDLLTLPDYWAITSEWLAQFTRRTGLQDILAMDGYGLWWSHSYISSTPSSGFGNAFAWIDLLAAIHEQAQPESVIVHGQHDAIIHLVHQVFGQSAVQIKAQAAAKAGAATRSVHPIGVIAARILMGIVYLIYALVRRPDICLFSNASLMRLKTSEGKPKLRDVYLGGVAQALQAHGWRTMFIEAHGAGVSWRQLWARGLFFPDDLLVAAAWPRLKGAGVYHRLWREWQERRVKFERSLAPSDASYKGYDLTPLVLPLVREQFDAAFRIQVLANLWRHILRYWRPRLLYINCYYGSETLAAIIAAKSLGIATVEQQHGVIVKSAWVYVIPQHLAASARVPLCDFIVVWGNYVKRLLVEAGVYSPDQVAVCGFPPMDALQTGLAPRPQTLALLDIPPQAKVVLYTSNQIVQDFYSEILDSIQRASDSSVYWIVKLHPVEQTRQLWERAIEQRGLQNVRVVNAMDFYALLAACDLHITYVSTTMVEAAVLGKPNLGLELANVPDPIGYAQAGACLPVSIPQVGETACAILNDGSRKEALLSQQEAFANDWCLHDGQAVERIVNFVEARLC